jgi:hypothetical protein
MNAQVFKDREQVSRGRCVVPLPFKFCNKFTLLAMLRPPRGCETWLRHTWGPFARLSHNLTQATAILRASSG